MTETTQPRKFGDISKKRGFKLGVVTLLFALLIFFIYQLRHVFNPVLIGGLIAYIFEPMIRWLTNRGIRRRVSIIFVYTIMLISAVIAVSVSSVALKSQIEELIVSIPDDQFQDLDQDGFWDRGEPLLKDHNKNGTFDLGYRGRLQLKIFELAEWWNTEFPSLSVEKNELRKGLKEGLDGIFSNGSEEEGWARVFQFLLQSAGGVGWFVMWIVMIPIYSFFIQSLVPSMKRTLPSLIPEAVRDRSLTVFKRIDRELNAFFRGKIIVCFLKGFLTYLGLQFLGVRFSFFIGFLAGGLSVIPYLGAVVGLFVAGLIFLLDTGSLNGILWIIAIFVLMEVIEFFLNIIVFGKEVGIHPLAFILALFIGGELFGVFGVIMAVPLVSVITILYKEFVAPLLTELAQPESRSEKNVEV